MKKIEKLFFPLKMEPRPRVLQVCAMSIRLHHYIQIININLNTYPAVYQSQLDRDKQAGVFPGENVFGPPQKPWLWTEKNQKALALLFLASGPLPNAANSNDVSTEFAAEHN